MSEVQSIKRAAETLEQLLSYLKIDKIISVDDIYSDGLELEDVLAVQGSLADATLINIFKGMSAEMAKDPDARISMIRRIWEKKNQEERKKLARLVITKADPSDIDRCKDHAAVSVLEEILPSSMLRTMTLRQWEEKRAALLEETRVGNRRVLILFDQDLSKDDGTPTSGIEIISSILAGKDNPNLTCGLITHTVDVEHQQDRWNELAAEHNLSKDRFVVISKNCVVDDPIDFVLMFKLLTLNPVFARMKHRTTYILEKSIHSANEEIEKITIFDFDHIVCKAAREEGIWEADMLFRLYGIFHRLEARKLAYTDTELKEVINSLREVSEIPAKSDKFPQPTSWRIQRKEIYEPPEHINQLHLPIELGDIFTDTDNNKKYILFAQPCDLMVRSDGKRNASVNEGILAEIGTLTEQERKNELFFGELPYFDEGRTDKYFAKFRKSHFVKLEVLDLCVFSNDGLAQFISNMECLPGLIPSWNKRFEVVKLQYVEKLNYLESADIARLKTELKIKLLPQASNSGVFKVKLIKNNGNNIIEYACKRIARLSRPYATALFVRFSQCLTRPSFESDLGRN